MSAAARVPAAETVSIAGEAGALEAIVEIGSVAARTIAVVCHPHPLHGGTMENKVVTTLARTLARRGAAVIRFNFRGVGDSEGGYDGGDGELDDAVSVVDWAARRFGGSQPLTVAGFSFGGAVAYRVADRRSVSRLITVAPAIDRIPKGTSQPDCRWLLIQGSADEIVAPAAVREWAATHTRAPEQVWLPGVGHFFHGELDALSGAVAQFVAVSEARC